jgi:hypothetical protein
VRLSLKKEYRENLQRDTNGGSKAEQAVCFEYSIGKVIFHSFLYEVLHDP